MLIVTSVGFQCLAGADQHGNVIGVNMYGSNTWVLEYKLTRGRIWWFSKFIVRSESSRDVFFYYYQNFKSLQCLYRSLRCFLCGKLIWTSMCTFCVVFESLSHHWKTFPLYLLNLSYHPPRQACVFDFVCACICPYMDTCL